MLTRSKSTTVVGVYVPTKQEWIIDQHFIVHQGDDLNSDVHDSTVVLSISVVTPLITVWCFGAKRVCANNIVVRPSVVRRTVNRSIIVCCTFRLDSLLPRLSVIQDRKSDIEAVGWPRSHFQSTSLGIDIVMYSSRNVNTIFLPVFWWLFWLSGSLFRRNFQCL